MAGFCTRCGAPHEDDARFCPRCGTPIGASMAPSDHPDHQQTPGFGASSLVADRSTRRALTIAGVLLLGAVGLAGALVNAGTFRTGKMADAGAAAPATAGPATSAPAPSGSSPALPVIGEMNTAMPFHSADGTEFSLTVRMPERPYENCDSYGICYGSYFVNVSVTIEATRGALSYDGSAFTAHDSSGNQYQPRGMSDNAVGTLSAGAGSTATLTFDFVVPNGTETLWLDFAPVGSSGQPLETWLLGTDLPPSPSP